jgi:hypothetical protein
MRQADRRIRVRKNTKASYSRTLSLLLTLFPIIARGVQVKGQTYSDFGMSESVYTQDEFTLRSGNGVQGPDSPGDNRVAAVCKIRDDEREAFEGIGNVCSIIASSRPHAATRNQALHGSLPWLALRLDAFSISRGGDIVGPRRHGVLWRGIRSDTPVDVTYREAEAARHAIIDHPAT